MDDPKINNQSCRDGYEVSSSSSMEEDSFFSAEQQLLDVDANNMTTSYANNLPPPPPPPYPPPTTNASASAHRNVRKDGRCLSGINCNDANALVTDCPSTQYEYSSQSSELYELASHDASASFSSHGRDERSQATRVTPSTVDSSLDGSGLASISSASYTSSTDHIYVDAHQFHQLESSVHDISEEGSRENDNSSARSSRHQRRQRQGNSNRNDNSGSKGRGKCNMPTINGRLSSSGRQRWKEKKRRAAAAAAASKSSAGTIKMGPSADSTDGDRATPILSNGSRKKNLDSASSPAGNLFLEMGDDEVGNHTTTSDENALVTEVTAQPPASPGVSTSISSSAYSFSGSSATKQSDSIYSFVVSPLEIAKEGLSFHPASSLSTDGDFEPSVSPGREAKLGAKGRRKKDRKKTKGKPSPRSVTDGVDSRDKGEGGSLDSAQALTSFPRRGRNSRGAIRGSARHDSSIESFSMDAHAESESTLNHMILLPDDSTTTQHESHEHSSDSDPMKAIQRALFQSNPMSWVQDFITGSMCTSEDGPSGGVVKKKGMTTARGRMGMCADNAQVSTEALIEQVMDDFFEDVNAGEDEDTTLETDEEEEVQGTDVSMSGSSTASSLPHYDALCGQRMNTARKKKSRPINKKAKKRQEKSRSRRGRSPTERPGYNSDGESIHRNASRSYSRGASRSNNNSSTSRGSSSGLSSARSSLDSIETAQRSGEENETSVFGASVAAESVMTQDQEAWMAMTKQQPKVESFFKKLISTGIQLQLNDPPNSTNSPRFNRSGDMFLQFGTEHDEDERYEQPRLLWTDGHDVSHSIELLDIQSIRQPSVHELEGIYPCACPENCFFLTILDDSNIYGTTSALLFEVAGGIHVSQVMTNLRNIIKHLARKIILGDTDWVAQLICASDGGEGNADCFEGVIPCAMADATDHLVKKTALMQQAQERRSKVRSTRQAMMMMV